MITSVASSGRHPIRTGLSSLGEQAEPIAQEDNAIPTAIPRPIPGLSVFVISHNEADRIGAAIAAVNGLASEIVVVDSGSSDATRAVAAALGARVIVHAWQGFGPQKRFAEDQCKGPWLLNLDADEVVSPELAAEIRALFAHGAPRHPAYRLRIAEQFPGEVRPHRFAYTLSPVRLYRKDAGRYSTSPVHDRVELRKDLDPGLLKHRVHHRSIRSLSHQISKLNYYSDMQVADMDERGRRIPAYRILYEMPATFLKVYLLRRHFLRGFYGVATAMNVAIARHLRVAKAVEMQRIKEIDHAAAVRDAKRNTVAELPSTRRPSYAARSGARDFLVGSRLLTDIGNPTKRVLVQARLRQGRKITCDDETKLAPGVGASAAAGLPELVGHRDED